MQAYTARDRVLMACCIATCCPAVQHAVLRLQRAVLHLQHAVLRCDGSMSLQMYTTEIAELFDVLYTKNLSKVRPH